MSDIYISYGQAETYWDCSFSRKILQDDMGIDPELLNSVSVWVDPQSGEVSVNHGYEPHSPEWRAERDLFATYSREIEAELVRRVPKNDEAYAAFLAQHAGPKPGR